MQCILSSLQITLLNVIQFILRHTNRIKCFVKSAILILVRFTTTKPNKIPQHNESERASELQGSFKGWDSRIGAYLTSKFGQKLTRDSLLMLAIACSMLSQIPLPRDYKRRKGLLLKWMDMHYEAIAPFLPYIDMGYSPTWSSH